MGDKKTPAPVQKSNKESFLDLAGYATEGKEALVEVYTVKGKRKLMTVKQATLPSVFRTLKPVSQKMLTGGVTSIVANENKDKYLEKYTK